MGCTIAALTWLVSILAPVSYPSLASLKDVLIAEQAANEKFIIELGGSFLGESSIGLAEALRAVNSAAAVVAVDTWHEHVGNVGPFTAEIVYTPPQVAIDAVNLHPEWLAPGHTLLFEQYVRNVNTTHAREQVLPIPLLAPDSDAKAAELGKQGGLPRFVYINAPKRVERLRHDLQQGWRLLACGGTLFGSGYHLFRDEIDSFAARLGEAQPQVDARVIHAPGAVKFENTSNPYSDELMILNARSNFSTWSFRGKWCSAV